MFYSSLRINVIIIKVGNNKYMHVIVGMDWVDRVALVTINKVVRIGI